MAVDLTPAGHTLLEAIRYAYDEWDGFVPHGPGEQSALRRLMRDGLVAQNGSGVGMLCSEQHDGPIFILTNAGRDARKQAAQLAIQRSELVQIAKKLWP